MDNRQAQADPAALQELARALDSLAASVEFLDQELNQGLSHLGQSYRDNSYDRFRSEYLGTREKLVDFCREARSTSGVLNKDVEDLLRNKRIDL